MDRTCRRNCRVRFQLSLAAQSSGPSFPLPRLRTAAQVPVLTVTGFPTPVCSHRDPWSTLGRGLGGRYRVRHPLALTPRALRSFLALELLHPYTTRESGTPGCAGQVALGPWYK